VIFHFSDTAARTGLELAVGPRAMSRNGSPVELPRSEESQVHRENKEGWLCAGSL